MRPIFPIGRLEDNQVLAFQKWHACGNKHAALIIKYNGHIYCVEYHDLETFGKIDLRETEPWEYDYEDNA